MEIRLLESFLAIAEQGNLTRAAEALHVTQPALTRQLAQLERELGTTLFLRGKKGVELTDDGRLLRRRASEILELVELTQEELAEREGQIEGRIGIGAGELSAADDLGDLMASFAREHPLVTFDMATGIAGQIAERLDNGLLDFGLFLEPIDTSRYDFVTIGPGERWVWAMRTDDPLATKKNIVAKDVTNRELIVPNRLEAREGLAQWFGSATHGLNIRATNSLGANGAMMVQKGLGICLCVEGSVAHWDPSVIAVRPLKPEVRSSTVLAWKRDTAASAAVHAFVKHIQDNL